METMVDLFFYFFTLLFGQRSPILPKGHHFKAAKASSPRMWKSASGSLCQYFKGCSWSLNVRAAAQDEFECKSSKQIFFLDIFSLCKCLKIQEQNCLIMYWRQILN